MATTQTIKQLLGAGVHFGHQTKRWNPKMEKYIFGEKNGIYIIDLEKTEAALNKATDFLRRLVYLSQGSIQLVHSDNGSEFAGEFERACQELGIAQVYSRVRTPKDNPALERFNWTVQDEWLSLSEVGLDDMAEANQDLTEWLIEYNSHRPHQALDYQTPLAYACREKVLPMSPASTGC